MGEAHSIHFTRWTAAKRWKAFHEIPLTPLQMLFSWKLIYLMSLLQTTKINTFYIFHQGTTRESYLIEDAVYLTPRKGVSGEKTSRVKLRETTSFLAYVCVAEGMEAYLPWPDGE